MDKIKDVILEFLSPEANLFVYSLSFGLLLSLAPSLIIFAMMFKWGNFLDIEVVIDLFRSLHLSNDIQVLIEEIFMEFMNKEYGFVPAITTLCLSFWLASRSINSFLLISASHEKVEVPKFAIRIQSIVMFLVFVAMLIGGVLVATLIYRFVNASLLPMWLNRWLVCDQCRNFIVLFIIYFDSADDYVQPYLWFTGFACGTAFGHLYFWQYRVLGFFIKFGM